MLFLSWFKRAFSSPKERQEQRVFGELYQEQAPRLFRRLITMGHPQPIVEEVIHEAFLVYWDKFHAPQLQGKEPPTPLEAPYAWLLRIAQNKVIDVHRKNKTAQQYQSRGEELWSRQPSSSAESYEQREILQQVLQRLPERDANLLILREGEGLSYDELARELALDRGSVGTLLRRARQAFHSTYQELQQGSSDGR